MAFKDMVKGGLLRLVALLFGFIGFVFLGGGLMIAGQPGDMLGMVLGFIFIVIAGVIWWKGSYIQASFRPQGEMRIR